MTHGSEKVCKLGTSGTYHGSAACRIPAYTADIRLFEVTSLGVVFRNVSKHTEEVPGIL